MVAAGSVLLQDEANSMNGDVAINMDSMDRDRYQQQLQLIEETVCKFHLTLYTVHEY